MLEIKVRGSRSWLCNIQAPILSGMLRARLIRRLAGVSGLFITLTYRRTDFANQRDLYRRQADEQHVPMFFRRLNRALWSRMSDAEQERWFRTHPDDADRRATAREEGRTFHPNLLKGKWMRKMEFQRGGWVHFHLVLLGFEFIPKEVVEECWGHGFTFVGKLDTTTHAAYLSKYLSKDDPIPAFLYAEKPRSVKVVASSPGFWLDTSPRDYVQRTDPATRLPCYQPIGDRVKIGATTLIVRSVEWRTKQLSGPNDPLAYDHQRMRYEQIRACDLGELHYKLLRAGVRVSFERGWMQAHCDFDRLFTIAREDAPELTTAAGPSGPAEVDLIHIQNPDSGEGSEFGEDDPGVWGRGRLGPWIAEMFREPTDAEFFASATPYAHQEHCAL